MRYWQFVCQARTSDFVFTKNKTGIFTRKICFLVLQISNVQRDMTDTSAKTATVADFRGCLRVVRDNAVTALKKKYLSSHD